MARCVWMQGRDAESSSGGPFKRQAPQAGMVQKAGRELCMQYVAGGAGPRSLYTL